MCQSLGRGGGRLLGTSAPGTGGGRTTDPASSGQRDLQEHSGGSALKRTQKRQAQAGSTQTLQAANSRPFVC